MILVFVLVVAIRVNPLVAGHHEQVATEHQNEEDG
jgi:hypothetical protein